MAKGGARPGAGRPKGSVNRDNMEFRRLFDAESARQGFDLMATLVGMANDPDLAAEMRIRAMGTIVPYAYPKLKAIEVAQTEPVKIVLIDASRDGDPPA